MTPPLDVLSPDVSISSSFFPSPFPSSFSFLSASSILFSNSKLDLSASNPFVPPLFSSKSFSCKNLATISSSFPPTAPPPNTRQFLLRSIRHRCLLSISNPNKKSIFLSPNPFSESMTVMVQGKYRSRTRSGAIWTRPKILPVPTPTATPSNLESNKWSRPHRSAHALDMMVLCAPLSTNACILCPFTSASMYSINTRPMLSGYSSIMRRY
mmetsp:Transcript_27820/g.81645  ORF Transcript_27820/g.81645 Transcript_27820/m.81645 type:complete len:211 (+) Transcript_27820:392-1024(+)